VNAKRIYRLYKEMGLQLRHEPPKRRVKAKLREGPCAAPRSNEVWAMDFVHDQLATGPKLRILTVVDTFSRFSPPWCRGLPSERLTSWRCSNGYVARLAIQRRSGSTRAASSSRATRLGKPTDNALIESFNGKFRALKTGSRPQTPTVNRRSSEAALVLSIV
jgi:putative transposase